MLGYLVKQRIYWDDPKAGCTNFEGVVPPNVLYVPSLKLEFKAGIVSGAGRVESFNPKIDKGYKAVKHIVKRKGPEVAVVRLNDNVVNSLNRQRKISEQLPKSIDALIASLKS